MTTALDDPNPNTSRPPVDAVDAYPLSVAQAGMVHHTELDPRLLPYHCVHSMRVRLPLHVELMRRAVRDVQARHPVLRTSFDFATQDEPVQLVHERAEPAIVVADLRGMPTEPAEWVLRELWHHERKRPFDLARAPLLRLFLHQRTDDVFQWTITEHHAILDAAGRFAVHTEVLDRYRRLLADPEAPPDPAPSRGYGDFVALEREIAADPDEQRYWTTTLAGLEPTTLPRWPTSGATGGHRTLELPVPADLATRLTALAGHAGVPIRTVLLAAHLKVVGIATGRHDIATGVVTSGRPDDSDVRGMFLNVPPLRVDLTGGTWLDLVRRVADAEREMSAHRRYPLASIQWTLGNVELFDTVFEHQPFPASVADFRAEPNHYALTTGYRHDPAESLLLRLDVDTTRVRDAQAEDIRDTYLTVLDAMTEPAAPHEALSPLTAATYQRLMVEWNGPARPYPVDRCVHELIEEQAHRTPDAVAVTDGVVELSYAELNRRANQLARRLLAEGAAPETVIAVLAERTASLVVILLAILKSGAAYLPLEPQYPAERQRYLLADSGATLVVAEHGLAPRLPDGPWTVLDSTRAIREADGLPAGDLGRTSSPDNLMYIIYTSGSTGKPKGVLVPHFGVVNYLGWCTEGYAARGTGGAPVFSSIAFDMIVPNLYTPLITGERLCMLDDSLDPVALADRLDELAPFTFIKLTPGHLDLLDQLLEPERARRLATTLAVGADAFPTRILDSWRAKDTVSVVLNEYGPTEASVGNTVYVPEGPVAAEQVPIGRAIPNTTMYVLDHAMNPVPLGVTGELYIGGDCVVRGYANKPRLTAERFVPDPFSSEAGARMYRTGDLGRWLPEGALEFQGRRDDQLKVNGYRVELGEIEAALVEHPAVNQSVAAVVGKDRLVGYYMADRDVPEKELLAHLAERLPPYMVPSTLMAIDTLPLNANGKVDRKALPSPAEPAPAADGGEPPRPGVETVIATAWQDLLYLEEVTRTDDFLALGGNSLLATELVLRLRRQDVEVDIAELMRAATLADLAAPPRRSGTETGTS